MVSKIGLYAYGLVGNNPKQLNILGIDNKNKVYPVSGRDICVMVSKINTDKFQDEIKKLVSKLAKTPRAVPRETEEILTRHENVVDALMKLTPVVPFKFGTILKNDTAALKMLRDYGGKFKKLLSKFSGRQEWGLKVYVDNQKFKDYLTKSEPKLKEQARGLPRAKSRGVAYLLGRKMAAELDNNVAARLAKINQFIFQQAGKNAYQAKLNKTLPQKLTGKNKDMILNPAFLIETEKAADFCQQVKKLIDKYQPMGLAIELSGPWPPYSFT